MSPDPSHQICNRAAERVEAAAECLGPDWPGCAPVLQASAAFRMAVQRIISQRGFEGITLAFIGPKKAGKSTLASLFITSEEKRQRLKVGEASAMATTRPTWIAARPPAHFDSETEFFIPCAPDELLPLPVSSTDVSSDYAILDFPGSNEMDPQRQQAARTALDDAKVKILVLDRASIESAEITDYLELIGASPVIPVVNRIRKEEDRNDLDQWEKQLGTRFPRLLPRIDIADWELSSDDMPGSADERREQALAEALKTILDRVASLPSLLSPQAFTEAALTEKLRHFGNEVADLALAHLPRTQLALRDLTQRTSTLPRESVYALLGDDQGIAMQIRARFRALLLARTPLILFPWRLAMSVANLIHGATDRLPLALLGSVPSLISTAHTALKNNQEAKVFAGEISHGLQLRIESVCRDLAGSQLQAINHALRSDLNENADFNSGSQESSASEIDCKVRLRGLETLQNRSTEFFQRITQKFAPDSLFAWAFGLPGFFLFWGIFAWPIYGLYRDFANAALGVSFYDQLTLSTFPSGAFSVLLTAALLALVPMGFFLLFTLAVATRRGRVQACIRELRSSHEEELDRLTKSHQLEVEFSEPRINACRLLLLKSNVIQ
ncbi:MAG: hypothetical protein ACK5NG_10920 [Chthoniobacterales bacterium]